MPKYYGAVDKFIHWFMALNIIATLIFSKGMSSLTESEKLIEYGDHGMSVTSILLCLVFRVIWRATHGFADFPESMSSIQKLAARWAHYLIYLLLIAQVLVGVLLASTTSQDFVATLYGINYSQFNLIGDEFYDSLISLHIFLYWLIVGVLFVHVLAALKHHYIDRDDVLKGMLPTRSK